MTAALKGLERRRFEGEDARAIALALPLIVSLGASGSAMEQRRGAAGRYPMRGAIGLKACGA
jgi:hypothetical protein